MGWRAVARNQPAVATPRSVARTSLGVGLPGSDLGRADPKVGCPREDFAMIDSAPRTRVAAPSPPLDMLSRHERAATSMFRAAARISSRSEVRTPRCPSNGMYAGADPLSFTAGSQDILQRMIVAQFVELDIFLEALQ
jgi:hypothetical protein